jgi:hypothetical protein
VNFHEQQSSKRPETWLIVFALSAFVFPSAELVPSVLERIGPLEAVAIQGGCQS